MPRRGAPGDPRSLAAGACRALKVFPLPGVVVFPGTPTPFHVFEPRYKQLFAEALASDGVVAVPTLAGAEDAPLLAEPVRPVAGVCVIEEHERLADGRYHVLLRGLARARLLAEVPSGKLYRTFRAELLEDVRADAVAPVEAEALEQLLVQIAAALPVESGATRLAADAAHLPPGALADLAAAALVTDPDARYALLAELDVPRRLELVTGEAAGVLLALAGPGRPRA